MPLTPDPGLLALSVLSEDAGARLDLFLFRALQRIGFETSRSVLQELIKGGKVTVNGREVKPKTTVSLQDRIEVTFPEVVSGELLAQDISLSVLYEDDELIVIDKQPGLVVHPASGNLDGTLVNALLHHCHGKLCPLAGEDRPGIVHRLDKDTSGCLVAAKSELAYHSLVAQFSGRATGKEYLAVTDGIPASAEGTISNRIGRHAVHRQRMAVVAGPAGKEAITDFCIVRSDEMENWASVRCVIHTGRTHQIRVHLKECLRCPILGDPIYSQISKQRVKVDRLMLHARCLSFKHPVSMELLKFEAPLPEIFLRFV
ncbi:MAG TPA: RluA family pseudouridine synthase [Verrucomicrobiales bacterium]|nr:RluA family pseudouridine synthase [Verrucomicrobiales bacterium]